MFDPDTKQEQTDSGAKVLIPPEPLKVTTRYYRCDKKFHVDQVERLFQLETRRRTFGLVWCVADQVSIYIIYGHCTDMKLVRNLSSHLKNSHRKGGQSQKRFERLVHHQRDSYYSHVNEVIQETFASAPPIKIFIATTALKQCLVECKGISCEYIPISDQDVVYQVVKKLDLVGEDHYDVEVQEFYDSLHSDMAVYGPEETRAYLEAGQLKFMIVDSKAVTDDLTRAAEHVHTPIITIKGFTELEARFQREFGLLGGIKRYKDQATITDQF